MPGKIIDVFVKAGDVVEKGQKLLILGAMKIEHTMKAPRAGTIAALHATAKTRSPTRCCWWLLNRNRE
ncbi:MAG: acetyl-CoA carboxylase biotin carboxyl carrier protein subunit [Asticcacaulis sp.]